ncbi:MAG: hypothetical protein IIA87_03340 [Nanoarchaeota archaeon]|nr:hypothetical protein [Nanoarchaeota archaeon]
MVEQRKLRIGKTARPNQQEVHVITIPPSISTFYKNTYFSITMSGTTIILTSGTKVIDIDNLDLEDYRI